MSDQPSNPMRDAIQEAIGENPVILFMKGNPDAPACGFSARTVATSTGVLMLIPATILALALRAGRSRQERAVS